MTFFSLLLLFIARIIDNALSTAKTILIQRNKGFLAAVTVIISSFLYFGVMKEVVKADNGIAMTVVSIASGIGCWLAVLLSNKFSRDRTFVNVIMSDDKAAMQNLRDFLALHHITNVASDSYTRDWNKKTITITAYANTKAESRLINQYLEESPLNFKRMVHRK